jgi:hypothetical protein
MIGSPNSFLSRLEAIPANIIIRTSQLIARLIIDKTGCFVRKVLKLLIDSLIKCYLVEYLDLCPSVMMSST